MATWAQQIAAAGVIRAIRVGELPDLGPRVLSALTETPNGYGYQNSTVALSGVDNGGPPPYQDLTNGYDVGGACRFDIASPGAANAGLFMVRFSNDRSTPTTMNAIGVAGEGAPYSEVYIQVCNYWNTNMWDTVFEKSPDPGDPPHPEQGGIKLFDLNTGWPIAESGASTFGFVAQTVYQSKVLNGYAYGLGGAANAMWDRTGGNYALQNQNTTGTCDYYLGSTGCSRLTRGGWDVIHMRVKILDRVNDHQVNYECDISTKAPGGAMTLRNSWSSSTPGYDYKRLDVGEMYGNVVIFPYMSSKSEVQTYATPNFVLADNIIISTQPILAPNDPTFVYGGPAPTLKGPFRRRRGRLL